MTRPESLRVIPGAPAGADAIAGKVMDRRFAGSTAFYRVHLDGPGEALVAVTGRTDADLSGEVAVSLAPGAVARAYPRDAG